MRNYLNGRNHVFENSRKIKNQEFQQKNILFPLLSMILFSQPLLAQTYSTVKGTIMDNENKALSSVTVSLLNAADSGVVKMGISEPDGKFDISVDKDGTYMLSYSLIGYNKAYSAPFVLKGGTNKIVEPKKMEVLAINMGAVTVNSKKPLIDVKPDRTIINIESSIVATGSSAMELLEKSPGIQIDNNDNINMKGKNGVRIYIDGKMVPLDSRDLAAYLKSIGSDDIEAIEMITIPGAKYDASGNAGIINIRLKKNRKFGTNGNISVGFTQGVTPKGNGAINLNYRDRHINIFTNIGGTIGQVQKLFDLNRVQKDTGYNEKTVFLYNDKSVNAKTGADFFVNARNTIGLLATFNYTDEAYNSRTTTGISEHSSGQLIRNLRSFNSMPGRRTNAGFNFNYRYADTTGHEINVDADYGLFRGISKSYQPNYYYSSDNNLVNTVINRNNAPIDIDIYTLKLDMAQKLGNGKLEYGAKYSMVNTKNTYSFFIQDSTGKSNLMTNKSSNFVYSENVTAAYVNYQTHFGSRLAMQAGLRFEQTISKGNLTRTDGLKDPENLVKRSYFDLFPNASVTWNISQKHVLNIAYNRRIDRPGYQDLNPFEIKLDELTFIKGNAFLRPQYTDNITLTHTLFNKINTSIAYSHVKDYSTQVTDTLANTLYAQHKNIGQQQIIGFSISSPFHLTNWWNLYAAAWYSYQMFDGSIDNNRVNANISAFGANMQNSFSVGRDYSVELTGWFNGPSLSLVTWKTRSMGGADLGVQKLLFHKKATIKLSATDLFHTARFYAISNFGGVNGDAVVRTESRTFRVNLIWHFGSSQIKNSRERHIGLENETNRIKTSN